MKILQLLPHVNFKSITLAISTSNFPETFHDTTGTFDTIFIQHVYGEFENIPKSPKTLSEKI